MSAASSRRERRAHQAGEVAAGKASRAGRDLPVAVGVGVGLAAGVLASLLIWKPAFLAVIVAAVLVGLWELAGALRSGRIHAPVVPVLAGGLALPPAAYLAGVEGLVLALTLSVAAVWVWRTAAGPLVGALRDVAGGVFAVAYVALLAAFAALMLAEPDGHLRVVVFILVVVFSDIGGYALGVLIGKHPMAPSISPKKSWEGLAGSVGASVLAGAVSVPLLLGGPWWAGIVLGAALAAAATTGDLAESTLKRDLGIKDMSTLLPGHGGLMDRLDSLLVGAPLAWGLLAVLVPA